MKKKLSIIDILIILIAVVCAVFAVKYFTANSKKAYNVPEVSYVVELKSLSDEYLDVFNSNTGNIGNDSCRCFLGNNFDDSFSDSNL